MCDIPDGLLAAFPALSAIVLAQPAHGTDDDTAS